MEKEIKKQYQLLRLIKMESNDGQVFYKVLVLFNGKDDSDLIRLYVKKDVFEKLINMLNNKQDDLTNFISVQYVQNFKEPKKSGFKPVLNI